MSSFFFNLLVNSAFSLLAGLLVVHLFLWLFRVETGPWKLFLLSLPFAKIVYDFARGVPESSVLRTAIDTFHLPPRSHYLNAGMGFSQWGPQLNVHFSVRGPDGLLYSESVGDYLALWLENYSAGLPPLILFSVLSVSIALVFRRLGRAWIFERERKRDRRKAGSLRTEHGRFRTIDIYFSSHFSGTPFTGGVFRPYICLPADAIRLLSPEEMEAVIAHELAHIRQWDLPVTIAVQVLGDLFWFLPGYRRLSRRIDRLREMVADQWAVRSGIEPALLASALIKLKEIPAPDRFILYSAFFRERSLLKARVENLLGRPERKPRFGWQNRWFRLIVVFWIFTAVMGTNLGGNHRLTLSENPPWINRLLEEWGLAYD